MHSLVAFCLFFVGSRRSGVGISTWCVVVGNSPPAGAKFSSHDDDDPPPFIDRLWLPGDGSDSMDSPNERTSHTDTGS